jgi:hypothetical protein
MASLGEIPFILYTTDNYYFFGKPIPSRILYFVNPFTRKEATITYLKSPYAPTAYF